MNGSGPLIQTGPFWDIFVKSGMMVHIGGFRVHNHNLNETFIMVNEC